MRTFRIPRQFAGRGMMRSRRTGKFRVWPLVLFAGFAAFYYFSNQEIVPETGRSQLVDMSREQEAALGLQSYSTILAQSEVLETGPEVRRVRAIGKKIVAVSGQQGFDWQFNVIRSDQANAFCLPGGKVAVYTGILPITENDAGLATVMGHEIAHAVARHGAERMAHQRLSQYGSMALGMSMSEMDPAVQRTVMGAFGLGSQFGFHLPFSRKHESEADYIGLLYLAKACFDPSEAPRLWERMGRRAQSGAQPELLSTHPAPETRVAQFKEWLPEAKKVYREHCG